MPSRKQMTVRFSLAERGAIDQAARLAGMSVAAFLRTSSLKAAKHLLQRADHVALTAATRQED